MNIIQRIVYKICLPNPQVIHQEAEREFIYTRNRSILFIQAFSLASIIIYVLLTNGTPNFIQQLSFYTMTLIIAVFMLTCRSYPNLFKVFYFILISLFGPLSLYYNKDSIFFNFVGVSILPTWMLYLSGSNLCFFLELILQLIYLRVFYKPCLINTIDSMSAEAFVKRMINVMSYGVLLSCIFLIKTHLALISAHQKAASTNNKRNELERQKIFLLGFSHELRNLLNSLIGNIQLCALEILPEKVKHLLHNSEVCGEVLLHLVTNILDIGKMEIGDVEINPITNDIYKTLEKAWNVCSQLIRQKGITGKMTIQKGLPKLLKFDNYRLTQILMNLIGNAVKFTETGSVTINVSFITTTSNITDICFKPIPFDDENEGLFEKSQSFDMLREDLFTLGTFDKKKIRLLDNFKSSSVSSQKGVLKLVVADTGSGISSEKLPHLFKKATEVTDDLSNKRLGTGLGLFVTKEIIGRMGGEIRVYSKENHGTVFIACLPVEIVPEREFVDMDPNQLMMTVKRLGLKAMIVDDVEFNIIVLSNYLQKIGVEVVQVARNGKEAVEKYCHSINSGEKIDIITMDVEMPVMDGKEASAKIRAFEAEHHLKHCVLLMVSGNCSESEILGCVDEKGIKGANMFLKKPVSLEDLQNSIKMQFSRRILSSSNISSTRERDTVSSRQESSSC